MTDNSDIEKRSRDLEELRESVPERLKKRIKSTAKKMLPAPVIEEVQQYRSYEKSERSIYLRTRISNGLGLSRPPKTARSFVFVCFGNIMRSPMCEALMKRATSVP